MDKAALRALMAERRAAAHAGADHAGCALARNFPRPLVPARGAVVSGYWPIRSEIDPRPLMRFLVTQGCEVALPITPPKGSGLPLAFRLWAEADDLAPGTFGLSEPGAHAPLVEPDLLLVPLLAFDRFGGRLGYGAGHYDRTQAGLAARKPVTALGLAYAAQEVERVPMHAHDIPLHGIVTETAYIQAMRTNS